MLYYVLYATIPVRLGWAIFKFLTFTADQYAAPWPRMSASSLWKALINFYLEFANPDHYSAFKVQLQNMIMVHLVNKPYINEVNLSEPKLSLNSF